MKRSRTEKLPPAPIHAEKDLVSYSAALALFLSLIILAWKNVTLLEDHDSISFIRDAKVFLSFSLSRIINLPPDTTPFYPLWTALFSLPGWSVETAARLCSVFFSVVMFISLTGIGRRLASSQAVFFALLLLSISPVMISLAKSVLTEPSYIAVIYLGLWIFHRQCEVPTWQTGLLLGFIFALGFLNRTEGLVYLLAIPLLQLLLWIFFLRPKYNFGSYSRWTVAFVAVFALLSLPQIWRVSHRMGHFAINGRQVWELILNNPDGKSYGHKIYGLDYSPQQINLEYIQSHPETAKLLASNLRAKLVMRKIVRNLATFYERRITEFIGPLGIALCAFGLLSLWRNQQNRDIVWILGFLAASLLGPLLHDVDMRHIAVIGPLLILLQGVGIVYLCKLIAEPLPMNRASRFLASGLPYVLFFATVLSFVRPLRAALNPPTFNQQYAPADFKAPFEVLQGVMKEMPERPVKIAARKGYFPYLAGAECIFLPYTDYTGLVRYYRLNRVHFLFLEHRAVLEFPFFHHFRESMADEFELLYEGPSRTDDTVQLYRFK